MQATSLSVDEIVKLPIQRKRALLEILLAKEKRRKENTIESFYPDTGPLRRALYPKHLEFFEVGAKYKERCLLAANRTGKTLAGCFEDTCHLTGEYPEWWPGHRFTKPVQGWVAGTTNETVRDILQIVLLGAPGHLGEGLIPKRCIAAKPKIRLGVPDVVDTARIKHVSGGTSTLQFKTYVQGRKAFEGTARNFIHLDEECPMDIYGECLIRTMTTKGLIYVTFTPLAGLTDVVLSFLPQMRPKTEDDA